MLLIVALSCGPKDSYEGVYVSHADDVSQESIMTIQLKENGKGSWKKEGEEVPFSWKVHKGGELRLHLKLGGVILGEIADGTIEIVLPGTEKLTFKKR